MNNQNEQVDPTTQFFADAKRKPWLIDLYIAIQSAISLQAKGYIDFNRLADEIMPRPDRQKLDFIPIGENGLKALERLFICECTERGNTDYHTYKFTRREDGKSAEGVIKI